MKKFFSEKREGKTRSLRTRIFTMMSVLVALQSIALIVSLFVAQVFMALDQEAFHVFENIAYARADKFNVETDLLVGNTTDAAGNLATQIEFLAGEEGIATAEFYKSDAVYRQSVEAGVDTVVDFLRNNAVTGSFIVFNGSNADKENIKDHSAIYIRNKAPDVYSDDMSNYQVEIGPSILSKERGINIGPNWDISLHFDDSDSPSCAYYFKPILASQIHHKSELERYGYWSPPIKVLGKDQDKHITYSMPLLDKNGEAFGVFGFEVSIAYLTRHYLPNTDLPYENSFFSLSRVNPDYTDVNLNWCITNTPIAEAYLEPLDDLPLKKVRSYEFYETKIPELGDMYTVLLPLNMYSQNSPFADEGWVLGTFVDEAELHDTSTNVCQLLMVSIILITVIAFVSVFFLTHLSTRQLSQLPEDIQNFDPYDEVSFEKTGLMEIDNLTAAIEILSQNVVNSSEVTSKIMELTDLPMGGYEISNDSDFVIVTDFVRNLMHKNRDETVTREEWFEFYEHLTSDRTSDENVYRVPQSRHHNGEQFFERDMWFRIQQAATSGGLVGIILDVSDDVRKSMQLEKELDHDKLTHLYNRVAFKREAYNIIHKEPDKVGVMIFADLDNLKYINDNFGHDVGDGFLVKAGEMFNQFSKLGGIVSRISGDEFAIYLHGYDSQQTLRNVLFDKFATYRNYHVTTPDGRPQRIRFSAGIAWYPNDSDNITDLLKLSDYAMYEAKSTRKGTIFEFNRESYKKNIYLLENREAINQLLDGFLIRFDFQPIVSLKTGEIYGYEALMRPLLDNFQSPLEVLAVASAESKMAQLEHVVVMKSYQYIADNIARIGDKKIFINSIPDQILSDEDRQHLVRRYHHIFENVVIEITEEQNLTIQQLEAKANNIKERASMIAIDDYGAGYSNEMRILSLKPDIIKIDMAIIQGVSHDNDKHQLVENIISFCNQKGIITVAEGVESIDDLDVIIDMGADYVQGYLLSEPQFELGGVDEAVAEHIRNRNNDGGLSLTN